MKMLTRVLCILLFNCYLICLHAFVLTLVAIFNIIIFRNFAIIIIMVLKNSCLLYKKSLKFTPNVF